MKKKLLFIAFSDLHLENWAKHNEKGRRLINGLDVLKQMRKTQKIHKVPILFTGDLFNNPRYINNYLLSQTLPLFKKLWVGPLKTYAISGNHDQSEDNTLMNKSPNYIETFSKVFKGLVCMDYRSEETEGFNIYGVPYITHDLELEKIIGKLEILDNGKLNILMLHTTLPGASDTDGRKMHSILSSKKLMGVLPKFDMVLTGHIHKPQVFKFPNTKVLQVGAPQHQRLTDRGCKMGYLKVYTDLSHEFVHMKYPEFKVLKEGESIPDRKHYYVREQKKPKKGPIQAVSNNFGIETTREELAISYIKEKKIKDRLKEKALIKVLKNVE